MLIYIPARGGSKGIPLKNIQPLLGKPLIHYTLDIVKELFDENPQEYIPFISSDDERIWDYCKSYGFDTGYRRPVSLAGDHSTIVDGIFHAFAWLKDQKGVVPESVLLMQPISPIRNINDLKDMIYRFQKGKYDSMFSVIPMKQHPYECLNIKESKWTYLEEPTIGQQRQAYKENYYFIDGSYYMLTTPFLYEYKTFVVPELSSPFLLKDKYIFDIDDKMDLKLAETILKSRQES